MKKVVLTIATVIFTLGAYAQSDTTKRSWDKSDNSYSSNSENQNHTDGYYFKDGKVVLVRNGKTTPLDRDVTLTNGTKITDDGYYTERGGTKMKFKEDEHIDLSGNRTSNNNSMHGQYGRNQSQNDGYVFQNGKMQHVRDGKSTPVDKDVTLNNGTVITSDGNYTERGGTKMRFNDGEHIDLSGKRTFNNNSMHGQNMRNQNYSDGYLFQNGRMVKIENGKTTPVDKDVTLKNGTIITNKGDYTKRGGTKIRFNEGDHMDNTGKIVAGKSARNINDDKSNKNMYLLKDSTNNKNNRN